ncbi:hypothetical protein K501DRAFT_253389 [Backusella circina FSU 941]|nr:hypothetical protein K501DRAFT_253389 [Backusella circina FSU 941]
MDNSWNDILKWQTEIKKTDDKLTKSKPLHEKSLPPIRKQALVQVDTLKPTGLNSLNKKSTTSAAENAEASKAKGNEYFGKKDFKNAIEYYTKAIEYNPTMPVYFINRAMAYLKINRYSEAERDCTQGISLQPKNVKALWRRGIARRELGRVDEARKDFQDALVIEPSNKTLLGELNTLPPPNKKQQHPQMEKRRLPIRVVDEEYPSTQKSTIVPAKPIKTSSSSSPPKVSTQQNTQPKAEPVKVEAVKAEPIKVNPKPQTTNNKIPINTKLPATFNCPRTNLEFERDWKTYKVRGDDVLCQYFKCIPPSFYTTLFKSSLESDQFEKIIDLLDTKYTSNETPLAIYDVLNGLSKVRRIDMLVMFLNKAEQQALQRLFQQMKSHVDNDKLSKLAKLYDIRAP